jgi:hypothetical protein
MKKMKSRYIFSIVLISLMFGCSEDFMELTNPSALTPEGYYTQESHANNAVVAAYASITKPGLWFRELVHWPQQLSDEFFATGFAAGAGLWGPITSHDVISGGGELNNLWTRLYEGINAANVAIQKIPEIKESDKTFTEDKEQFYLGQAHFLRAFYYFELTNYFGDQIPMITKFAESQEDFYQPAAADGEVLSLMVSDLQTAQQYLPKVDEYRGTDNLGRASKGAATALLGKLYLYRKDWAKAEAEFDKLINQQNTYGTYELDPNYRSLHNDENANGIESIWELQFADLGGANWGAGGDNPSQNEVQYFTTSIAHNRKTDTKHWWNFSIRQDRALGGRTNPGEEGGTRDPKWIFENDGDGNFLDNRAYATFWGVKDGATYTSINHADLVSHEGVEIDISEKDDLAWNEQSWSPHPVEGYCFGLRKYEEDAGYDWNYRKTNYTVIRYADVLLMYAEANLMQGDEGTAKQYIQMVRDRANMAMDDQDGMPNTTPGSLPSVDDLMAANGWDVMDALQHERYVELFAEGVRWFDIQRWGITDDVVGYKQKYSTMKGNNFLLPVPDTEVNNNPNYEGNIANQ